MRVGLIAGMCALGLTWAEPVVAAPILDCSATGREIDPSTLFDALAPAVAAIEGSGGGVRVFGTGFLWDRAGHVVTNEHVVRQSPLLVLRFADGRTVRPRIVGTVPDLDIAVLRVDPPPLAIPVVLGDSRRLKVGQEVYAIGNPYGVGISLSHGLVSGLNRTLDLGEGRRVAGAIQTDASLNPGNSGGPLLDARGCLIGMAAAIMAAKTQAPGIGFALPADLLERTIDSMIGPTDRSVPMAAAGPEKSELGIMTEDAGPGARVIQVIPGSRAASLGTQAGDIITHANGRPVRNVGDLAQALRRFGSSGLRLTFLRGKDIRTVEVLLASASER